MKIRTYSELRTLETIEERFKYLSLRGKPGDQTFGFDRYMNQMFYRSKEWRDIRHYVIVRDNGCDLGIEGFDIHSRLTIHHMQPIKISDIVHGDDSILDPEYLITTTLMTHNAIHYGDESLLPVQLVARTPGDTKLW